VFRDDLHVERARSGDASPDAGKDDLMNIGNFDEHWLFRDEEDELVKHEEIALYSFQICFETRMTISAASVRNISLRRALRGCNEGLPLEAAGADDFLL